MTHTITPHGNWFQVDQVADTFALLPQLPDNWVDVINTDPPYEEHCQDNQMSGTTLAKVDLPFAPLASRVWIRDIVRIAKRWGVVCCTIEDLGRFCDLLGGRKGQGGGWVRGGMWYKPNSMGQLSGDRPAASYEGVAIVHRPDARYQWNGRGGFAFWSADPQDVDAFWVENGTRGEPDRHPNQKPLKLCLEWVNKFSNYGETIFDPWSGSARIGEAALLLGRNYIGWDNDPKWVEHGRARLAWASQYAGSLMGWITCEGCKGTGWGDWPNRKVCGHCEGRGKVWGSTIELHACRLETPKKTKGRGPAVASKPL